MRITPIRTSYVVRDQGNEICELCGVPLIFREVPLFLFSRRNA